MTKYRYCRVCKEYIGAGRGKRTCAACRQLVDSLPAADVPADPQEHERRVLLHRQRVQAARRLWDQEVEA
jgi:hypothetical protein